MRNFRILGLLFSAAGALFLVPAISASAPNTASNTVLTRQPDFDSRSLMEPSSNSSGSSVSGFSLTNPNRFSMHQSYSVTAISGGGGASTSGLYLNTVEYRISDPLLLFVDVGIYTPLYSSYSSSSSYSSTPWSPGGTGAGNTSLVLPRMGLEYKPTDRLTLNLELVNGPDAWKAYGPGFGSPTFFGSRFP